MFQNANTLDCVNASSFVMKSDDLKVLVANRYETFTRNQEQFFNNRAKRLMEIPTVLVKTGWFKSKKVTLPKDAAHKRVREYGHGGSLIDDNGVYQSDPTHYKWDTLGTKLRLVREAIYNTPDGIDVTVSLGMMNVLKETLPPLE